MSIKVPPSPFEAETTGASTVALLRAHPQLCISYVNPGSIRSNPHPTRKHSKKQIEQIAASLKQFGFVRPILVDGKLRVIAGEAVLRAAISIGYTEVPVICRADLTEDQARILAMSLNRLAELSSWDEEALKIEFKHFLKIETTLSFDIGISGWETPDIDRLLSPPDQSADGADVVPASEEEPVSRPGDLWLMGEHRQLHGNALEALSYERLMQDELAQMVCSDSPFNVPIKGHVSGSESARPFPMANGEMSRPQFTDFLKTTFALQAEHSIDGSLHFQFMDWRHMREMLEAGDAVYDELKNLCIWTKDNAGMGSLWRSQHELIFVWKKGKVPHVNNVELGKHGRWRSNVWRYPGVNTFRRGRQKELSDHVTPKSVGMIADAIKDCSDRGGIVLDTFLGSGTTIIAAERTGRRCFGMELDGVCVDVAVRRWQTFTGRDAVHAGTGLTFAEIAERRKSQVPDAAPVERRKIGVLKRETAV